MAYTVIGVFENADVANKALHALVSHGIGREHIDVTTADINQDNPTGEFPENDSFHNFFRAVFTGHEHDVKDHLEAARRGTTLTAHVRTLQDAQQVQQLLDQHGAVNASEYARRYVAQHGSVPLSAHGPAPGPHPDSTVVAAQPDATTTALRSRIIDRPLDDDERLR
ncbi:hypothetical protein SAMN00120144_2292 [Hymenobacter roseosalivarius DSM 11622]|uniref:General stress protein 17M-like domain-containing protein n=1 Tax=Hymenobacter roseosalivarius DSM 11622 TaxID=645990 RepID=A0A1W1VX97_9BACT|nr:hypothetical protein [Hymenobacter roseosalivarius]SMB97956.1 hypothetical protein SAMN00120144_2292 [Hymenobacter roseosalivarius DSM 11622]